MGARNSRYRSIHPIKLTHQEVYIHVLRQKIRQWEQALADIWVDTKRHITTQGSTHTKTKD